MYEGASNFSEGVDFTFKFIYAICLVFFVAITATMIWFVIRYNKKRHPKAIQIKDNTALEITWTIIPFILVLLMFYYGYINFAPERNVPANAMPVTVIAKMWTWSFRYEGNKEADTLVVPLYKPVKLNLTSLDVVHSLYIPAFRIKEDVVPGKNNYMWFIPQQPGIFNIVCTEYCGLRHSYMESAVKVVSEAEFATWLHSLPGPENIPEGLAIIRKNACTGCHSLDGSKLVSVSFKGLFGKTEQVTTNGKEKQVTVDDQYIMTSIYDPAKDLVVGYPNVMKSYKGIISVDEVKAIIEYMKTLK